MIALLVLFCSGNKHLQYATPTAVIGNLCSPVSSDYAYLLINMLREYATVIRDNKAGVKLQLLLGRLR